VRYGEQQQRTGCTSERGEEHDDLQEVAAP